ncbi:LOW QUALITY PROTEIN: hypothetical protein Cgig2_014171 [Carnegiea gigantea]|uniref:Uncharacterized protein n=1 Tax=Carnegiea gigantea TaxID=171969 RepID=A0A9Q1QDD0_9CARY|nr:LOW QUALITY PROTEIN: hypothetical protein Cgig2_014171 [Carnegiea gigantea]
MLSASYQRKQKLKGKKAKEFNNRMSPKELRRLNENLNNKQAVKEVVASSTKKLIRYRKTRSVGDRGGRLHDVSIPKGSFKVIEANDEINASVKGKSLLKHWIEQWRDRDRVPKCAYMIAMMESQVDKGEDFRRYFIAFVVPIFVHCNQRGDVNYLIINTLLDLGNIVDLNRAQYTMAVLI